MVDGEAKLVGPLDDQIATRAAMGAAQAKAGSRETLQRRRRGRLRRRRLNIHAQRRRKAARARAQEV